MGRRKTDYVTTGLVLILTIIHFVFLKFSSAFPSHRFLFAFYFINLVLVPGCLLSQVVYRRGGAAVRIMLSFVLGSALIYAILTLFTAVRWNIYYIGIAIPAISLVLAILQATGTLGNRQKAGERPQSPQPVPGYAYAMLASMIVLACVLVTMAGDPLLYTSDSPDHIAYIRTISRTCETFPDQFLYTDGGTLTRDIRKGLVHAMWGTLNSLTGRSDARVIWPLISMIGSIFIILSLFCAGILLFRSASIGLLSAVLFIFIYNTGLRGLQLITVAYPFPFGKIYLFMFLSFFLRSLELGRKRDIALSAASSLAACGTHINHFLIVVFLIFIFSLVRILQSPGEKKKMFQQRVVPITAIITAGVNLPYLALRYFRDYAPNNDIHSHVQAIFRLTDKLIILNPVVFFRLAGPLFILTVISVFLLWNISSRDRNLRLLLWGVIFILALVFNPLVVPFLMDRISYLLMRFEIAIPSMIISAYLLKELWNRLRGRKSLMSRRNAVAGWIAVACLIGYPLSKTPFKFAYSSKNLTRLRHSGCLALNDLYETINKEVPRGRVILSDPVTSYCIPAFTDQFVVCTYDQHSIPNDSTALRRILDCRDIYLPGVPIGNIINTLRRYNAEYIVINGRIPHALSTMYWKPDRKDAEGIADRLSSYPEQFQTVYSEKSVSLLYYTGNPLFDSLRAEPLPIEYLGPQVTLEETGNLPGSGEAGIHIKDVRVSRERVPRGDTLRLSIEWVKTGECVPRSYTTLLRFNTGFEKGPLYSTAYGKIYRKIYELIHGRRYRFSSAQPPLNGIYSPDLWPPLRTIRDGLTVKIPEDISPGIYSISVKLMRRIQYPNYTFADILTDDDYGSGVVMGKVAVE